MQEILIQSLGWEDPLKKEMASHTSILTWGNHGERSLLGYSPWGGKESDMTEQLTLLVSHHTSDNSDSKFSSVQSLSRVHLFATPWTAAHQASLSITNSQSLLKLIFIESVLPSNHLILCCPLLLLPSSFPASRSFPVSQFFTSGGKSIGVSDSASVLPMNIQG